MGGEAATRAAGACRTLGVGRPLKPGGADHPDHLADVERLAHEAPDAELFRPGGVFGIIDLRTMCSTFLAPLAAFGQVR